MYWRTKPPAALNGRLAGCLDTAKAAHCRTALISTPTTHSNSSSHLLRLIQPLLLLALLVRREGIEAPAPAAVGQATPNRKRDSGNDYNANYNQCDFHRSPLYSFGGFITATITKIAPRRAIPPSATATARRASYAHFTKSSRLGKSLKTLYTRLDVGNTITHAVRKISMKSVHSPMCFWYHISNAPLCGDTILA